MTSTLKKENTELINNELSSGRCKFFVARKNRYCKMTVGKGREFCGEHASTTSKDNEKTHRIPCPLDSKHSCYAHSLEKHLKKCNARTKVYPEYVVKNVNRGTSSCIVKHTLSSIDDDILVQLIKKVKATDLPSNISSVFNQHHLLEKELSDVKYGASTRKHLLQNSSLLGHLSDLNVLRPETCFIEFGAGRGQLSYWIGEAMAEKNFPCLLVPIDRASNRHKFDNKLRSHDSILVHRLRVDIADLYLANVPQVANACSVVAVCKHLCGVATDLALRCLTSTNLKNISGILMAPCCHHRVEWDSYLGQECLLNMGFTKEEFSIISSLVSWATCGISNFNRGDSSKPVERLSSLGMTPEDQQNVGRRCKLLLDYGRLKYLEQHGFSCRMVYYTDQCVSPENLCLIATR